MMLLLTLLCPAFASPDRLVATYEVGTDLSAIAVSPDGRWVAAVEEGSGELRILDTFTWDASANDSAPCTSGVSGVAAWETDDGDQRFYVGCDDGTVAWVQPSDDGVELSTEDGRIDVATGTILGLIAGTEGVYVLESVDEAATMHMLVPSSEEVDGSGSFPVDLLTYEGYEDLLWTGTNVIVLHGSDNLSLVNGTSASLSVSDDTFTGADCLDGDVASNALPFFACGAAGVLYYAASSDEWVLELDDDNGLSEPTALVADTSDTEDPYLLVADDGFAMVFPLDTTTGYPDADATATIDLGDHVLTHMVATGGYAVGANSAGSLVVMTGRPWVEIDDPGYGDVVDGDEISLTFSSDTAGDWELQLGLDGTVLDSGTIEAGGTATTGFTVGAGDADLAEGGNLVRIVVDADGVQGADGVILTMDNPPSQVSLGSSDVGYGENLVELSFEGVDDEDLASYHVYVSTTEFSASDYDLDGPAYDGPDDLSGIEGYHATSGYFVLEDVEPGEAVSLTLYPLTNGITHYLAVRALDEGGQEGPMSNVVSATPQETYTLAERTNEKGGFCGTSGAASALGALLAGGLALSRRRGAPLVFAALLGLVGGGSAWAGDGTVDVKPKSSAQLRFGPMWFDNGNPILDQFSEPNNIWWLEGGPSWKGIAEINTGIGWYNKAGYLMGEDGTLATGQMDRMQVIPLTLSGTLRLDLLREQPIVPMATIGGDYWIWRELYDAGDEKEHVGGGKTGWHYGFGVQILLDFFDQNAASLFEARSGVKDSYIVAEYRVQTIEPTTGIVFSADQVTVGLKINR